VDFDLDEAQREIAGLAREVLEKEPDPDAAWTALRRAGLLTLAVPEELGGAGLGTVETALVLTEVGQHTRPVPALETLALGVLPIVSAGTPAQRAELLGAVAEGAVLTAAVHERSAPLPVAPRTTARADGDGWVVSGTLLGVRFAERAHRILTPATLPDGRTGVLLVDPASAGCVRTPSYTSSGLPECLVELDGVRVGPGGLLGGVDAGSDRGGSGRGSSDRGGHALAELHRAAVLGACAVADGVLAGALALTATHLRTREQFGRPLATFQAAAGQIADVYLASRTLHLATTAACWRSDRHDVAVAGYWLTEQLMPALHTCQHLHGGIGVDTEYPLHRHYAWGKDLARFVGGNAHRLEVLACTSS
jgi:hypothetical protein